MLNGAGVGGLRDTAKPLLSEVCVEGETDVDSKSCHGAKADTVNKAEATPTGAEHGGHASLVLRSEEHTSELQSHSFIS